MRKLFSVMVLSALIVVGAPSATAGPTPGGLASDDIEWVGFVPFDQSTSTGVTIFKKYMYLTSWKNISIYDISNPESPALMDTLPIGFMFENEDVEVSPDESFLLFSAELPRNELHVYDVEDKTNINEIAVLPGGGGHTSTCILGCKYTYSSTGAIVDLSNPAQPKLLKDNWKKLAGITDGIHDLTEYKNGFVITSPYGTAFQTIDVRNPLKPKVLANGRHPNPAGFIFHSGNWPNQGNDRFIIMQGERNAETRCSDENGPILTYGTSGWERTKSFTLLDQFRVQNGTYADGSPIANGLGCSAHWFTEHGTFNNGGLVAVGYYEHGTRFLNISETGKIKEVGFFLPYGGSTSAAYWVSNAPGERLVYSVDYARGIDILRWTGKLAAAPGGQADLKRPRVKLRIPDKNVRRGARVPMTTLLGACERDRFDPAGTRIKLQKKVSGNWKTLGAKKFTSSCRVSFSPRARRARETFRTFWPKQNRAYTAGNSGPRYVRTH